MDVNSDYNATFKSISVKLKKRFLRKPNVSEAIEEYTLLSKQLENEECHGLSAYCMQQVAKCYHSVGNIVSESAALQTAARQYLNSEIGSSVEANIVTFSEDLLSSISVYEEAIKLHCEQNERHLAAKISLELADVLALKFEKYFESISYYERAIGLFSDQQANPLAATQVLVIMMKLGALKVC
jgi:tetratricopeptide (TPR) repeat protein